MLWYVSWEVKRNKVKNPCLIQYEMILIFVSHDLLAITSIPPFGKMFNISLSGLRLFWLDLLHILPTYCGIFANDQRKNEYHFINIQF